MKNIAVLFYDLTVEYHITVAEGITEFFRKKDDVTLFIAPVNVPHATTFGWDYQYWTTVQVLKSKSIDAVIVVTNSFVSSLDVKQLSKELEIFLPRKVVSIAIPLDLEGSSYTCTSSRKTYFQIIEHLVKKHNRTKIGFVTAEIDGSPEAEERLSSFYSAMKKNKLEVHKDWIIPSDFSPSTTHQQLSNLYKKKEDVPFDALLCANDYSAFGAIHYFEDIGMRVPEDICVFGFDDSDEAVSSAPTISTVDQHIKQSAYKAAELTYQAVCGEDVPQLSVIDSVPVYRQSCGCVKGHERTESYVTQEGEFVDVFYKRENTLNLFGNALDDLSTIYHMLNMTETINNLDEYFESLKKTLERTQIRYLSVCLYDKEIELNPEDTFELPSKAKMLLQLDYHSQIFENYYAEGGISFNPENSIIPKCFGDIHEGCFYIIPVSLRNINYGYLICELPMNKYTVYEVYLKIIANSFVHSYVYTKSTQKRDELEQTNIGLQKLSTTDELTKILNRRGFMDLAQHEIDFANSLGLGGSVFFFDLDGLKKINDTWGHSIGDKAIQIAARVLRDSFQPSDIVGRLSGDEFAVISPGFIKGNTQFIKGKIIDLSEKYSKEEKLPFVISTSLGIVEFDEKNHDIDKLLFKADKELYKEKKIKHSNDNR